MIDISGQWVDKDSATIPLGER